MGQLLGVIYRRFESLGLQRKGSDLKLPQNENEKYDKKVDNVDVGEC